MADLGSRHARDITSLVAGLLLLAIGGLFLVTDLSNGSYDLRWLGPVVLVAVGVTGLAASARRRSPR